MYSSVCALLWAVAVVLFKKSGEQVSPVPLNLFKGVVGASLMLLTLLVGDLPFFSAGYPAADWLILLASGAIGIGVADSVFFASLNRLGAGRSAIVDCLYSPFIILGSFIYLHEPVGITLLFGLVLMTLAIFVGTWKPARIDSAAELKQIRIGVLLGIVSMLLMAVGIVMAKPVLDRTDPWWATTVRLLGGVALLAVHALARHRRETAWIFRPGRVWKILIPTSVVGAYLAMFFWISGMKYTHTTVASVLNQASTIHILVLATLFLREPLTGRKLIAILLGFAGGVLATL